MRYDAFATHKATEREKKIKRNVYTFMAFSDDQRQIQLNGTYGTYLNAVNDYKA